MKEDIQTDEFFCISNQDFLQPTITSLWWYFSWEVWWVLWSHHSIVDDIVMDFFIFGLLQFPARWDDIIDVFSSQFAWEYLWISFYNYHLSDTSRQYEWQEDIYALMSRIATQDWLIEDIELFLSYIDASGQFIHTKYGYIISQNYQYHYDREYIGLSSLLLESWYTKHFSMFYNQDETKHIKYFMYMYSYLYDRPLSIDLFALYSQDVLWSQWDQISKSIAPDAIRLFLLQHTCFTPLEDTDILYTLDQCDRFVQKWRNISRIIPIQTTSLSWLQQQIVSQRSDLTEYDTYLLTKLHDLYDEILFLQSKNNISQATYFVLSTLWNEICDVLLYILKKLPWPVTSLVSSYVILFSNHLLYPFIPTSVLWFLHWSWYVLEEDFFTKKLEPFVDKNYKSTLMFEILSQWSQKISDCNDIQWFVLQTNRDFLEYFKSSYDRFSDFIGQEYPVTYLDESESWPDDIEIHKMFTLQWWVTRGWQESIQSLPSLSVLQWQLQYKQQLLQTMKNTIVRMRTMWQQDKILQFQSQIDTLLVDIADIEYQISKLKYF
jgi:hypothetical protein